MSDTSNWHTVTVKVPLPTPDQATALQRVIQVDPVLKPSELSRQLQVVDSSLVITFKARTVAQARVALDHCLSDVELIVQTMSKFGPEQAGGGNKTDKEADSLEVGMKGQWQGIKR
ncbi:hypothetical protein OIV83_003436 [Microbotryomycetes sp. JL201]|nr:hypothetical protein OIV83_003436 [Microbotryomycetes sp. JL201]